MNAIEFINQLVADNKITTMNAQTAFSLFASTVGEENTGTYAYFRTKFNNAVKESGVKTVVTVDYNKAVEEAKVIVEIIMEELPTRQTKNYMTGDEIPEVPRLMPTGTIFDEFICDRITTDETKQKYFDKTGEEMPEEEIEIGGFTRKCVDIVAGPPGSGKTTSRNLLGVKAKHFARLEQDKNLIVHFISGEMRDTEWAKELNSCEMLKEVEVTYMLDYVGYPNYEEIFWESFGYGDIVICDSLPAIISHFKMSSIKQKPESQMIFDFIRRSLQSVEANNNNVQLINQANKDGNYKGGTELPHMMSSLSFVQISGTDRYMIFAKNRNNGMVGRKLFFSKKENGDIEFNDEAYIATYKKVNDKKQDLNSFMNSLTKADLDKLNTMGEGSATEMTPEEMGTSERLTDEEQAEMDILDNPDLATAVDEDFDALEREIRDIEANDGKFGTDYMNLMGGIRRTNTAIAGDRRHALSDEDQQDLILAESVINGNSEGDIEAARMTRDRLMTGPINRRRRRNQ